MKVKKHDDNTLVIEDFPVGIGIFGFSMALFAAGARKRLRSVHVIGHQSGGWNSGGLPDLVSSWNGSAKGIRSTWSARALSSLDSPT